MKTDKICVSYDRKFNRGNYESLRLEATVWADLEDGDNPIEVMNALQDLVRDAVQKEYRRLPKLGGNGSQSAKAALAAPEAGNPQAGG